MTAKHIPPTSDQDSKSQHFARRVLTIIDTLLSTAAAIILTVLLSLILLSVILRYVFSTGFIGTEELAIWLHIALIALGAPLSLGTALSMRFDLITRILPAKVQLVANIAADAFTVLSGLILLFGSGKIISLLDATSPSLGIPEWVKFSFLAASGLLLIFLLTLQRAVEGHWRHVIAAALIASAIYWAVPHINIDINLPPSLTVGVVAMLGLAVSAPLAHAFLAAAYIAIAFGSSLPEAAVVSTTVSGMSKFLLLAIPFFLLVGTLLSTSGAAAQLVRFAASLVGHHRAGLAQTTLLTSALFSGASGSSVANAAFGAATFHPQLVKEGYPPAQAGAIIAASSVLDNVIPPSIAFLVLAAATNLSVGSLLIGGLFAGAIMALFLSLAIHLTAAPTIQRPKATASKRRQAAIAASPAFGLGIIVVAGIRFGVVTTTEAAAIAAIYTLLLGLYARMPQVRLLQCFQQSAREAAAIGLLIGTTGPFVFLLAVDDIASLIASALTLLGGSAVALLLLANIILLLVGLILDIGAALLLFGPLLLPSAIAAGIDPIHFGVIIVVNLMISGLTPPVGMLIFVVSSVTHVQPAALFRAVLPYLLALIMALAVICTFALST